MTRPATPRRRRLATLAVASTTLATALATVGGIGPSYAASSASIGHTSAIHLGKAGAGAKKTKVIVLLRNQHTDVPASARHLQQRLALIKADQRTLLAELRKVGVTGLHSFTTVNGFSATVTAAQAAALKTDARVATVVADATHAAAPAAGAGVLGAIKAQAQSQSATPAVVPPAGTQNSALCGTAANPKIEPEALSTTRDLTTDGSPNAQQLATGKGVTVAFIADTVDPTDPDFIRNGQSMVTSIDLSGAPGQPTGGAEAMGDASAIGAQGNVVYDISQYNSPVPGVSPVGPGCDIKIVGMAPGANILGIGTNLFDTGIIEGIDYAVTHGASVINESFGLNATPDSGTTAAIPIANAAAVAAGLTVTASTGDAGTTGTIGTPASEPNPGVIAVGASTDSRLYQQTGYAAVKFSNGKWTDNNISSLSSGGVTQGGSVPDLVAPGEADWALCSTNVTIFTECTSLYGGSANGIQPFGGTSQSAPITAGVAALVIQAYRDTHQGASPTPALVKSLIVSTARDLGVPADEQGAGLIDARAAVEAARSVGANGGLSSSVTGSNLLLDTTQLDLSARAGDTKWATVNVTNLSSQSQTLVSGSRVLSPLSSQTQTIQLNSAGSPVDTPFTYVTGAPWIAHKVTFQVPAGADRLALQGAWQGAAKTVGKAVVTPVIRFTLLDPSGTYVANSRPQGGGSSANYANLDVRRPVAGTWTAIIYTAAGPTGYTGPVIMDTSTQRSVPGDSVVPGVVTIPAGASRPVYIKIAVPTSGGDTTENLTLSSSGGTTTSVPVVMRTKVDLTGGSGTFAGTITGGNARAGSESQTSTYEFEVPWGAPTVSVGLALGSDPGVLVEGALISPSGEVIDAGTNEQVIGGSAFTTRTLSVVEAKPAPGHYRFVVMVENPVSGAEISQPFTGTVSLAAIPFHSHGLPQHGAITLKRHVTHTLTVSVTNPTATPLSVQLDPRKTQTGTVALAPLGDANTDLPAGFTPNYLVPPGTTSLTTAAVSDPPNAQVELSGPLFAPDLLGNVNGATSTVTDTSPQVGRGVWFSVVQEILSPGETAPVGTTTGTASATTQLFDTDVTSTTGDPWLQSIQAVPTGTNADGGTPVVIQPGQTKTISVTITPSAAKGTTVTGTLNVVTWFYGSAFDGVQPFVSSSVLAAVPYKYTVS